MSHADSVGFHGMTLTIVIVSNVTWKKIKHRFIKFARTQNFKKNEFKLLCKTNDLDI